MPNRKTTGAVVMSAIVMIGFYTLILNNTNALNTTTEPSVAIAQQGALPITNQPALKGVELLQKPQSTSDARESEKTNQRYNNGSFSTDSDFSTPSGEEGFNVTLNIKDGQIESVNTVFNASHPHSEAINDRLFKPGINDVVVGRAIDDATLEFPVNGASLHSLAFNTALENIKKEALKTSHNVSANN